jgi:hypothetical protein
MVLLMSPLNRSTRKLYSHAAPPENLMLNDEKDTATLPAASDGLPPPTDTVIPAAMLAPCGAADTSPLPLAWGQPCTPEPP